MSSLRTVGRTGRSSSSDLVVGILLAGLAAAIIGSWHLAVVATTDVRLDDLSGSVHLVGSGQAGTGTWILFAVIGSVMVGAGGWLVWHLPTGGGHRSDLDRQRAASHQWARPADVGDLTGKAVVDLVGVDRVAVGLLAGRTVTTEAGRSVMVLAPAGAGKTPRVVVPILLSHRGPAVVTSVKSDVFELTAARRAGLGRVMRFDPAHPERSLRWSPLEIVSDWSSALRAASYFTSTAAAHDRDQQFWTDNAEDFMAPLLLHAALERQTMADVADTVYTIEDSAPTIIRSLIGRGHRDAANRLSALMGTVKETRDGVLTTARTICKAWNHPDIQQCVNVMAGESGADVLHVADLVHSTDTLFLVAAASEQKIFAPVFETLINAVYREIEMAYAANGGHPLSPRLLMMLDEAANIAKVRRLPEMASAGAGQGLLLVTVWQDEGQIVTAFSADVARTIMSNHWARVYLGGISDAQTLRNLSALIGKDVMTLSSTSSNDSLGGRVSRGRTEHEFEVAPAGSLSALRGGESIVVCAGYKPMRLRQRGWWESKELRAMVPAEVAARFDADYATTASKRTTSRR